MISCLIDICIIIYMMDVRYLDGEDVGSDDASLLTGRHLVAALLDAGCTRVFCLVRAADIESAQRRLDEAPERCDV